MPPNFSFGCLRSRVRICLRQFWYKRYCHVHSKRTAIDNGMPETSLLMYRAHCSCKKSQLSYSHKGQGGGRGGGGDKRQANKEVQKQSYKYKKANKTQKWTRNQLFLSFSLPTRCNPSSQAAMNSSQAATNSFWVNSLVKLIMSYRLSFGSCSKMVSGGRGGGRGKRGWVVFWEAKRASTSTCPPSPCCPLNESLSRAKKLSCLGLLKLAIIS